MSYVLFSIIDVGTGNLIGGTMEKVQNYDTGIGTITTWSCAYTKMLTGLTVGSNYTLKVQGAVDGVYGTYDAIIDMINFPEGCHMALTVMP